jgi:hypothetical protein
LVVKLVFRSAPDPGPVSETPAGLQSVVDAAAGDAAVELFRAYGVTIAPLANPGDHKPMVDLAALGIVRFTAPALTGMASLGASTDTLRRSNGRGTSDRDWVAELANQFVGRFKLKLLRAGFELWSIAPVTVSGRLLATAVSQPQFAPMTFRDSRGGSVCVWIEIEVIGALKITTPPAGGEIPGEGEVILF